MWARSGGRRVRSLIYPGAYPEGTAIRFESFEVWRRDLEE